MYSIEIANLHLFITVQFFCILRRFFKLFKDKYLATASYVTPLIVIATFCSSVLRLSWQYSELALLLSK